MSDYEKKNPYVSELPSSGESTRRRRTQRYHPEEDHPPEETRLPMAEPPVPPLEVPREAECQFTHSDPTDIPIQHVPQKRQVRASSEEDDIEEILSLYDEWPEDEEPLTADCTQQPPPARPRGKRAKRLQAALQRQRFYAQMQGMEDADFGDPIPDLSVSWQSFQINTRKKRQRRRRLLTIILCIACSFGAAVYFDLPQKLKQLPLPVNLPNASVPSAAGAMERCRQFFDAYVRQDGTALGQCLTGMGEPFAFTEFQKTLSCRLAVKYGNASIEGETASVPVTIQNIRVDDVLKRMPSSVASVEEATAAMLSLLGDGSMQLYDYETNVKLISVGGEWRVAMTAELSNALLGNYPTCMQSKLQEVP